MEGTPLERDDIHNMSMREKSTLKRRINREHNSNFRAGYININENYLHKTGIRGRKRYLLYCVILILIVVALLNALMTASIMYLLRFTHVGMKYMEFIPDSQLLRFFATTTFSSINIISGNVGGRANKSLLLHSDDNKIILASSGPFVKNASTMSVSKEEITLTSPEKEAFTVVHPDTGDVMFTTKSGVKWNMAEASVKINAPVVQTPSVQSRQNVPKLMIESDSDINISGTEGVHIQSKTKNISVYTERRLVMDSKNGGVSLDAMEGIFLNKHIPLSGSEADSDVNTYKLCVCMPSGRVFSIQVPPGGTGIDCQSAASECLRNNNNHLHI